MPRFVEATDCSARTLDIYDERKDPSEVNTGAAEVHDEEDTGEEDTEEEDTGGRGGSPRPRRRIH